MGVDSVINKYQVSWLVFIGDSLTDVDSDWTLIVCSLRAFFQFKFNFINTKRTEDDRLRRSENVIGLT